MCLFTPPANEIKEDVLFEITPLLLRFPKQVKKEVYVLCIVKLAASSMKIFPLEALTLPSNSG